MVEDKWKWMWNNGFIATNMFLIRNSNTL